MGRLPGWSVAPLAALVAQAGCVPSFEPPQGRLGCEADEDCPSGWVCRADGRCWRGPAEGGLPEAGPDAASEAGVDGAHDAGDGGLDAPDGAEAGPRCPGVDVPAGEPGGFVHAAYDDFRGGSFPRGDQVQLYVAAGGGVRWYRGTDLDGDGHADLAVAVYASALSPATVYDTDSFVFFGDPAAAAPFEASRSRRFPTHGATGLEQADLDGDGRLELLFANEQTATGFDFGGVPVPRGYQVPSFVYRGAEGGPEVAAPVGVPGQGAHALAVADLDGDGWLDVVVANHAGAAGDYDVDSTIVFGSPEGLATDAPLAVPTRGARDVCLADVDGDGLLDLLFANYAEPSELYLGSALQAARAGSATLEASVSFPTAHATGCELADLDGDGRLEAVFAEYTDVSGAFRFDPGSPDPGAAVMRMASFETVRPNDVAVADLDGDGWLDVVFANVFHIASSRDADAYATASYVYFGSAGASSPVAYRPEDRVELAADGATGVQVFDFDEDGLSDLFFATYRQGRPADNQLVGRAVLYRNEGDRAFAQQEVQVAGAFGTLRRDLGNPFDRRAEAIFVSRVVDLGAPRLPGRLGWVADTPAGSSVALQLRSAETAEGLASAPWLGPDGTGERWYEAPGEVSCAHAGHRYVQYRVRFRNPGFRALPALRSVSLSW